MDSSGAPLAVGPSVRPGELTPTWRLLLGLTWLAAFFAYAAIWQASVQLGISTWWIGPRAQPTGPILRLAPFVACLVVTVALVYNVRRATHIAIGLSIAMIAWSLPDFSRSTSLALTELVVGLLLLATSAAALTGRRVAPATAAEPSPEVTTAER